jgi:uncharacterized membrane protein
MRWVIAAFYVVAGVAHFAVPEKLLAITPPWVPSAPQVIFLTGVFEFTVSIALVTRPFRYWAGIAMGAYVWPANFRHAIDGIDLPYISNSWLYHGPASRFSLSLCGGRCIARESSIGPGGASSESTSISTDLKMIEILASPTKSR